MEQENNYINVTLTDKAGKGGLYFSLVDCLDEGANNAAITAITAFYNAYPEVIGELTNYIAAFGSEHYAGELEVTAKGNSAHPWGPAVANAFIFRYSAAGNLTLEDLNEYPDTTTTWLLDLEQGRISKLRQVRLSCDPNCKETTTYNAVGKVATQRCEPWAG